LHEARKSRASYKSRAKVEGATSNEESFEQAKVLREKQTELHRQETVERATEVVEKSTRRKVEKATSVEEESDGAISAAHE
jgi:hypothetical protein